MLNFQDLTWRPPDGDRSAILHSVIASPKLLGGKFVGLKNTILFSIPPLKPQNDYIR